jgi:hypothetical protein
MSVQQEDDMNKLQILFSIPCGGSIISIFKSGILVAFYCGTIDITLPPALKYRENIERKRINR